MRLHIETFAAAVSTILSAMQGPDGIVARAAWNGNADFDRNGVTVIALASALGLTTQQVDDMFIQASQLTV